MHRYVKRSMGSSVRRPAIGMASCGSSGLITASNVSLIPNKWLQNRTDAATIPLEN